MTISKHSIVVSAPNLENLKVISAQITMESTWTPYVQGTIEIAPQPYLQVWLNPNANSRITVLLRQDFGDSDKVSDLTALFGGGTVADITTDWGGLTVAQITSDHYYPYNDFGVRASTLRYFNLGVRQLKANTDFTYTITVASDEALLLDYALVDFVEYDPESSDVRTIVNDALARIGGFLQPSTVTGTVEVDSTKWLPGVNGWDYLEPLFSSAGLRLYCNEKREWYLQETEAKNSGTVELYLDSNVVTYEGNNVNRDDDKFYDAVVIEYNYLAPDGTTVVRYDIAQNPNFTKVLSLKYDTPYPGAGAAERILRLGRYTGDIKTITTISDYSAEPSKLMELRPFEGGSEFPERGYIESVTWNIPGDEMTLKTTTLPVIL